MIVLSSPDWFSKQLLPLDHSLSLLGKFIDMVTELGKQMLFPFLGTAAFAFIDYFAEVGVVRDGIVLLIVMREEGHRCFILHIARLGGADEHHLRSVARHAVEQEIGGEVLFVDVEGHRGIFCLTKIVFLVFQKDYLKMIPFVFGGLLLLVSEAHFTFLKLVFLSKPADSSF